MMGKSNPPLRLDHCDGQQLYQNLSVLLRGEFVGLSFRSIKFPLIAISFFFELNGGESFPTFPFKSTRPS